MKTQENSNNKFQQILDIFKLPLVKIKIDNILYSDESNLEGPELYIEIMKFLSENPNHYIKDFSLSYIDKNNMGSADYFTHFPQYFKQSNNFLEYAKKMFDNNKFSSFTTKSSTRTDMQFINPKLIDILEVTKNQNLVNVYIANLGWSREITLQKFQSQILSNNDCLLIDLIKDLHPRTFINYYLNSHNLKMDWNKIIDGETLFVKLCKRFIEENKFLLVSDVKDSLFPLIKKHMDIDVNKPLDQYNNSLLHKLVGNQAIYREENFIFFNDLLLLTHNGKLLFNVNIANSSGEKIIDIAKNMFTPALLESNFNKLIEFLRSIGSVEPKEPISTNNSIEKLDLNILDGEKYIPRVPLILKKLYEQYSFTEKDNDEIIRKFKLKIEQDNNYKNWENKEWRSNKVMTIPEVIDLLSKMTDVKDRLPGSWDFSKALAAIITIANTSDNLTFNLINCLSQLKMCDLGKLINLLGVIQDKLLEDPQLIDYDNNHALAEKLINLTTENIEDSFNRLKLDIPPAIARWYYDTQNPNHPEQWNNTSLTIDGYFKKVLMKINQNREDRYDSYHFTIGIQKISELLRKNIDSFEKSKIINFDSGIIKSFNKLEYANPSEKWHHWYKEGEIEIGREFFKHAISLQTAKEIKDLFNNIDTNPEYIFGLFTDKLYSKLKDYYKTHVDKSNDKQARYLCKIISESMKDPILKETIAEILNQICPKNIPHSQLDTIKEITDPELNFFDEKFISFFAKIPKEAKNIPLSQSNTSFSIIPNQQDELNSEVIGNSLTNNEY